jgi:hypothetical protein
MALGHKTGGRQAGTPNKATSEAREAIGQILNGNVHKLNEWLDTVADGIKVVRFAADGSEYEEYVVKPNPAKAFDMLHSLLEFHVPKLTRMQLSGHESDSKVTEYNLGIFGDILKNIKMQRHASSN